MMTLINRKSQQRKTIRKNKMEVFEFKTKVAEMKMLCKGFMPVFEMLKEIISAPED